MPIYEYQCNACGERLEIMQKISEPPLTQCPECNESGLRKLVSAAAFRLKGSGWYETDFKDKKARRNVGGTDDGAADKGGSKAEQKEAPATESKKPATGDAVSTKPEKKSTAGSAEGS